MKLLDLQLLFSWFIAAAFVLMRLKGVVQYVNLKLILACSSFYAVLYIQVCGTFIALVVL